MKPAALVCLAAASLLPAPASAGRAQWKVFEEESVSMEYRNAADTESLISISCSARDSRIWIPVGPGVKPPPQPASLEVTEQGTSRRIVLTTELCGGQTTCTDRADGDVSLYTARAKTKNLVLALAERARSLKIDAPGARNTAPADQAAFAHFADLCGKQK